MEARILIIKLDKTNKMAEELENKEQGQQGQQGGDQDKVTKQYEANIKKLVALIGGKENFPKSNIPSGEIGEIVTSLLAERKKGKIEEFKKKANEILDKKVEFDKAVRKEETEFKNKVSAKKKEFNEELLKLFAFVDDIKALEESYYSSINGAANQA